MMYVVTFASKDGPVEGRVDVRAALDELGPWSDRLKPAWLLESGLSSRQIRDRLAAILGPRDRVFVAEFTRNWASYGMGEGFGEWMRRRRTVRAAHGAPESPGEPPAGR